MDFKNGYSNRSNEKIFQTEISSTFEETETSISRSQHHGTTKIGKNSQSERVYKRERESQNKKGMTNVLAESFKSREKFKPDIRPAHIKRTPTPSEEPGKEHENETNDTGLLKLLSMRNIARRVRNIQLDRQRQLDYTGNETIEHKARKFKPEMVEPVMLRILEENLQYLLYDPQECSQMSLELSEELKDVVKSLKYPRYKFVVMVTIGQKNNQTVSIGSRSLWNKDTDTFASVSFANETLFSVAIVFATYFE